MISGSKKIQAESEHKHGNEIITPRVTRENMSTVNYSSSP